MKTVSKIQTIDGALFDNKNKAAQHEAEVVEVERLIRLLKPKKFDTCEFANGGGYIQLKQSDMDAFVRGYKAVIETFHPDLMKVFEANPRGIIGRYLDDNGFPAYSLWCLLCQIGPQNRLYGQQYFANHPGEAKNKQVN